MLKGLLAYNAYPVLLKSRPGRKYYYCSLDKSKWNGGHSSAIALGSTHWSLGLRPHPLFLTHHQGVHDPATMLP